MEPFVPTLVRLRHHNTIRVKVLTPSVEVLRSEELALLCTVGSPLIYLLHILVLFKIERRFHVRDLSHHDYFLTHEFNELLLHQVKGIGFVPGHRRERSCSELT